MTYAWGDLGEIDWDLRGSNTDTDTVQDTAGDQRADSVGRNLDSGSD